MKLTSYLFFIGKRLFYKKKLLFLNLAIISLGFIVLGYFLVETMYLDHYKYEAKKYLKPDVEKAGVAWIPLPSTDEIDPWYSCMEEIAKSEEVECIGDWDGIWKVDCSQSPGESGKLWKKITSISKKHPHMVMEEDALAYGINYDIHMECLQIQYQLIEFFALDLYKGSLEVDQDSDKNLFYLGYNFREIPVGTVFRDGDGKEYEVAGILAKNSRLLDSDELLSGGMGESSTRSLDNVVLEVTPNEKTACHGELSLFTCKEGYSFADASNKISEIAKKYGY
ncbi:MAG: hypothetical protein K6G62_06120, partial [Eubacterium sp.]|nr:hypothetical protein [Eubacterium sp.]